MPVHVKEGRDHWYHRLMQDAPLRCEPEPMDAEDMLYILYTSGTTGKPKGIVHTTGGYLVGTYATTKLVFDMRDEDVYWCTADIGWVTGHSYVVYGPLANGATVLMYEGAPDWPQKDRFWSLIEQLRRDDLLHRADRDPRVHALGHRVARRHDLSSLRLLGSVGEPINPEAWMWYHKHHRRRALSGRRHLVADRNRRHHDHAAARRHHDQAGLGDAAVPGHRRGDPERDGARTIEVGGGLLALTRPWPSMLRGIYGDPDRYVQQYWTKWGPGVYVTGDGAKRDADGNFWLLGRVDDVINVAGHRIGTMEVESALVDHPSVAEAAVVGTHARDQGTGDRRVRHAQGRASSPQRLAPSELKEHVVKKIGAIARPDDMLFTADLPKTRSGKIMRRLLRDIAEGKALGDTTTLADPAVVAKLKADYDEDHHDG